MRNCESGTTRPSATPCSAGRCCGPAAAARALAAGLDRPGVVGVARPPQRVAFAGRESAGHRPNAVGPRLDYALHRLDGRGRCVAQLSIRRLLDRGMHFLAGGDLPWLFDRPALARPALLDAVARRFSLLASRLALAAVSALGHLFRLAGDVGRFRVLLATFRRSFAGGGSPAARAGDFGRAGGLDGPGTRPRTCAHGHDDGQPRPYAVSRDPIDSNQRSGRGVRGQLRGDVCGRLPGADGPVRGPTPGGLAGGARPGSAGRHARLWPSGAPRANPRSPAAG